MFVLGCCTVGDYDMMYKAVEVPEYGKLDRDVSVGNICGVFKTLEDARNCVKEDVKTFAMDGVFNGKTNYKAKETSLERLHIIRVEFF